MDITDFNWLTPAQERIQERNKGLYDDYVELKKDPAKSQCRILDYLAAKYSLSSGTVRTIIKRSESELLEGAVL
jgi:hypothetical protein